MNISLRRLAPGHIGIQCPPRADDVPIEAHLCGLPPNTSTGAFLHTSLNSVQAIRLELSLAGSRSASLYLKAHDTNRVKMESNLAFERLVPLPKADILLRTTA